MKKKNFRVKGYINEYGNKKYYVEEKNLFSWDTFCINTILYKGKNDNNSCITSENTIFDCPKLAKKITEEYYKLEDICKKNNITMVYDEKSCTLKFIPNSNLKHFHYFWTEIINDNFIYDLLDQAAEKEKYLNKKWIEETFEVEKI